MAPPAAGRLEGDPRDGRSLLSPPERKLGVVVLVDGPLNTGGAERLAMQTVARLDAASSLQVRRVVVSRASCTESSDELAERRHPCT